jgi:manganese/iron transport system permease protein
MQRALAEALLMGVVCGLLGSLVVLRGLTYTGESLSHTLLPGAAVAIAIGVSAVGGALVGGVLAALLLALLVTRTTIGEDTAVSLVFTGTFAAGVILLSTRGSGTELDSLLFGSILGVSPGDVRLGLATSLVVAAVCLGLARGLVATAFDRAFAAATGLHPQLLDVALLVTLAGALTVALRGVGTLLVLALLVAPAAAGRVLARRVWTMLWLAPLLAALAGVVGLELSYHAGAAAGPAIALTALGEFVLALALRARRTSSRGWRRSSPA